jgi:hypothetical protein
LDPLLLAMNKMLDSELRGGFKGKVTLPTDRGGISR